MESTTQTASFASVSSARLASASDAPLYFEDLAVGDRWISPWREISGDDVSAFATLTGDHDPLHRDDAGGSPFGEPVAHGLLGMSVMAGLSSQFPVVKTLALVNVLQWRFEAPIFFGDRVQVLTEVESVGRHGRRAGRVTWLRQLLNGQGKIVQRGQIETLVSTRAAARRLSPDSTARRSLPPR